MSYSQALEEQLRWLRWAEETARSGRVRIDNPAFFSERVGPALRALAEGETFYWSRAISRLIADIVPTLPESWRFDMTMLPSQRGFCWFDGGLLVASKEPGKIWIRVEALAWSTGILKDSHTPVAHLIGLTNQSDEPAETRFSSALFHQGEPVRSVVRGIVDECRPLEINAVAGVVTACVFASCLSFLQQRILIAPQQRAERHARKRLERAGYQHEPLIRVVELRRKQSRPDHDDEHEAVDWSCQWVVSGHWRQQWHPSLNAYQPRWIMPYVKGPEDKPLKPPRAKVFAVVR